MRGGIHHHLDTVVTHGCPLSIAYKIVREGMRVGEGHRRDSKGQAANGFFCMAGGDSRDRVLHARDRSGTVRDEELQLHHVPCGWSTSVVLALRVWPEAVGKHLSRIDSCWKTCVRSPVGSERHMPFDLAVLVNREEMMRYIRMGELLHSPSYPMAPDSHQFMVCGGKNWHDNEGEHCDPLYCWSDRSKMRRVAAGSSIEVR